MTFPIGTTHFSEFYGHVQNFKQVITQTMNEVSEEYNFVTTWYSWEIDKWVDVGQGFSSRRVIKV